MAISKFMDKILEENLDLIKKASKPGHLSDKKILERIKNIKWSLKLKPKTCEVTVNSACNNRCIFCYSEPVSLNLEKLPDINDIYKALYLGLKSGSWIAVIIGGEPTLRKDIGKIANFARKIGYPCIKICSNGLKLSDKKYVRSLKNDGFNMFDISIHGYKADIHDRLVGVPGAYSKIMKAIENLKELNCEIGTNQVINKINYSTFPQFMDLAYNDIGINYYNIIYEHYIGVAKLNRKILEVPISEVVKYIKEGLRVIEESKIPSFARIIVNIPPCFLENYLDILADWEKDESDGAPLMVENEIKNMVKMKNEQSAYAVTCKKCYYYDRCRGFDREYLSMMGDKEFKPIKNKVLISRIKTIQSYEKN
jgi:MoaA/NifB/PqqE/SkfB family radical SAM enzyme